MSDTCDRFLKTDLHLHSSSCYSRSYSEIDFINRLKSVDLDVISITDHNIIDVDLYKKIIADTTINKYIIVGTELNLAIDPDTISKYNLRTSNDYFHAILWFRKENLDDAWNALKSLLSSNGIDVNKSFKEISKQTEGKIFYLNDVNKIFSEIDFYLTFHESKSERNLSDYLKHTHIPNRDYKRKLFYFNNHLAVEGGKKSKPISDFFEENLNILVTRFFFSDPLKLSDIGTKFTWVNFDGDFNNLILPLSDPEVRVFTSDIQMQNPQNNRNDYLESIKFDVINRKTKEKVTKEILFSPGLNGIIGSRGSGKSMLANIINGSNLAKYSNYFDIASVQYKFKNKQYQNSIPKSKYLAQNSLLSIFEAKNIKDVDFLLKYYENLKQSKKESIDIAVNSVKKILDDEKSSINSFIKDEVAEFVDLKFIDNLVNQELLLEKVNDKDFVEGVDYKNKISTNVNKIKNDISKIKSFEIYKRIEEYTELLELNKLVDDYKVVIDKNIDVIISETDILIKTLTESDNLKMELRKAYLSKYIELITSTNGSQSLEGSNYLADRDKLLDQLKKVTRLRFIIQENQKKIKKIYDGVISSVSSLPVEVNGFKIQVTTSMEDKVEFEKVYQDELKNKEITYGDLLIQVLINQKSPDNLKEMFNGSKYKGFTSVTQYIDKFYTNYNTSISNLNNYDLKLIIDDKNITDYSPGKQSEILLELFLHEEILTKDYQYIILDQPEDNLDTKTITSKLIDKIRSMKLKMQLFVVSHSATVIINGDSEIVIYAYDENNIINYDVGKINSSNIKKSIVEVLDGGEKNLKIRLNKYDFNYKEII